MAALHLLTLCFQNEELQKRGGEFLKVAASNAVLDETLQRNAGLGIQKALKNVVTFHVPRSWKGNKGQEVEHIDIGDEKNSNIDDTNDQKEIMDENELVDEDAELAVKIDVT